jgi:hypothetical protein
MGRAPRSHHLNVLALIAVWMASRLAVDREPR